MASVEAKVKAIIIDQLGVNESDVTPDAHFVDDLGADSRCTFHGHPQVPFDLAGWPDGNRQLQ